MAALGGWLALRAGWGLAAVFGAQALAPIAYGLINSIAIARGAWFKVPTPLRPAAANPRPAP
jgi:hypothetical protein